MQCGSQLDKQLGEGNTSGVVSEGVFAESLQKFCGKFAIFFFRLIVLGKGAEILRNFCGKFLAKCSAMTPSLNDPRSKSLIIASQNSTQGNKESNFDACEACRYFVSLVV